MAVPAPLPFLVAESLLLGGKSGALRILGLTWEVVGGAVVKWTDCVPVTESASGRESGAGGIASCEGTVVVALGWWLAPEKECCPVARDALSYCCVNPLVTEQ